jgi:dTDP-glucose 4,6-dehydratase
LHSSSPQYHHHCEGIELIIKKGNIGETYCLGGDCEYTNIDFTKLLLELMEKDENMIEYVDDRKGHDLRYAIDFSKAKKELGFEPKTDFKIGLKKTIDWYIKNKDWWMKLKH